MKLINSLFTVFVSLFISAAAFGQAGSVLVAGNPALTQETSDVIVKYYERGLNISFNANERGELESLIARNWRDALKAGGSEGLGDFMKTVNAFNAMDEAKRARLQDKIREAVLGDLRGSAVSGGISRFVLDVYESRGGETSSADQTANEPAQEPAADAGTFAGSISTLAGEWVWGSSGSSTYSSGGALWGSNGSRHVYRFGANGAVEYTGIMNIMSAGCRMQIFSTKKGRASLSGDTLTVSWAPADFSRDDSCSPSKNYKKKMPAETETYKVRFNDSYGQRQLCMTQKNETCYSPSN